MAENIPTTQVTVLERVIARIINQLPQDFGTKNCFLTLDPLPPKLRTHPQLCCTVSPMGGMYEGVEGGGHNQVFELSGVIVGVWSAMVLDEDGHAEAVLNHQAKGLLRIKRRLLKSLAGHNLVDENGDAILISFMAPKESQHPQEMRPLREFTGFTLYFSTEFEWDLSEED